MRQIITALLVVILAVSSSSSAAAAGENLTVGNYVLAGRERIERSVYDYTFRADITNNNTYDIRNATAKLKDNAVSADVPDGTLSFGDVPAGGTVTSTDTFTVRVNRRFEFEASSLTWETDFSSDVPPEITLTMHDYLYPAAGRPEGISFTLEFRSYDTDTYTLRISQTVETDTGGEISVEADFPSEWTADTSGTWLLSETVTAHEPGMFGVMVTTVTIVGTDVSEEAETILRVEKEYEAPLLRSLRITPSAISVSEEAGVIFWTDLGMPDIKPSEIVLEETDGSGNPLRTLGQLVDDGTSGDSRPDNGVYTGTFDIVSNAEGTFFFRGKATFPGVPEPVYTDLCKFGVTRFPTGVEPTDTSKIVTDPETGVRLISNEVSVSFAEGTDPDTIKAIADTVDGTVVGMTYGLGFYQIRFPGNDDVTGVYRVIAILKSFPEVETAEPVFTAYSASYTQDELSYRDSHTPDDSSYSNNRQWALSRIRADEAWVISRGKDIVVGVLDSGADRFHPDLEGNILEPTAEGIYNDIIDLNGHGTAMTGIIAAVANNDTDLEENVVGIAWNSKVLPLKALGEKQSEMSDVTISEAIYQAISDTERVHIINMSGYIQHSVRLKSAVRKAFSKDILVVASSPQYGSPYPARYADLGEDIASNVLSVNLSLRHECMDCYGSHTNIMAPGKDILTTMPRYPVYMTKDPDSKYRYEYSVNYTYFSAISPSAATAVTSGAAAVLWSAYPHWSAAQVRDRLVSTGRQVSEATVYRLTDTALAGLREEGVLKHPLTEEDRDRTEKLYTLSIGCEDDRFTHFLSDEEKEAKTEMCSGSIQDKAAELSDIEDRLRKTVFSLIRLYDAEYEENSCTFYIIKDMPLRIRMFSADPFPLTDDERDILSEFYPRAYCLINQNGVENYSEYIDKICITEEMTEEELCSKDPNVCDEILFTPEYPDRDTFINLFEDCKKISGPSFMAKQKILNYTAFPNQGRGQRRLDLFDAVFNGNFDIGLSEWTKEGTGTAGVLSFLGAERRLVNQVARLTVKGSECSLTRHFPIQPGVKSLDISFDYNFISPEGSFFPAEGFNDAVSFEIQFYDKYGNSLEKKSLLTIKADSDLLRYNLTDGFFSFLGTDGQDDTKMTGWKHHVSENLSVPAAVLEKGGKGSFGISIRNGKDNFQNCSILADNIGFKTSSRTYHSADYVPDFRISLAELLRVIQFYNEGHYHCRLFTEDSPATTDTDGYAPGTGDREGCTPHDSDYAPQDWRIGLNELLRLVQFYTLGGYRDGAGTEDGFTGVAVSEAPSDISISPSFDTSLNDDGIPAGESVEIAFTVGFSKNDGKTYTVSVTQNIHDADGNTYAAGSGSAPLSVTPNFVETWTADRPMMWILTETVEGGKPGVYGIKTTVEIVGTGETAEAATVVNVIPLLGLEVPDP